MRTTNDHSDGGGVPGTQKLGKMNNLVDKLKNISILSLGFLVLRVYDNLSNSHKYQ